MESDQHRQTSDTSMSANRSVLSFVGRTYERALIHQWLRGASAPRTLYAVSGIGGVGKTALLREWSRSASAMRAIVLWIDGRVGVHTPQGFLDQLEPACMVAGVALEKNQTMWQGILHTAQSHRLLIIIDNFEALSAIDEWLTNAFWAALPSHNVAMVVAARAFGSIWPSLVQPGHRLVSVPLGALSTAEASEFVSHALPVLEPRQKRQVVERTGGHPLALSLAVEVLKKRLDLGVTSVGEGDADFYQRLTAHWLRELVDEDLYRAIDVLSLVDSANQETLSAGLGYALSKPAFDRLADLSFVQRVEGGVALHDIVRAYLLIDWERREPQQVETLRRRLSEHLLAVLRSGSSSQQVVAARRLLTVALDDLPIPKNYADLAAPGFSYVLSPYRPEDLPFLQIMVRDWAEAYVLPRQRFLYQRFLGEFAEKFPQDIRVLRSNDGRPVAASFFCLVHQGTGDILSRYFPDEVRECLTPTELQRSPEHSSTYYAILVGVDMRDKTTPTADLVGLLIRHGLALLGTGTRVTLVATNPDLKQLLGSLGFAIIPTQTRRCDVGDLKAEVCTLDLTGGRFADWISFLMTKRDHSPTNQAAFVPRRRGLSLDAKMVREALIRLRQPDHFQRVRLVELVPWDAEELRIILMRGLTGRDATVLTFLTEEQRQVLNLTYVERKTGVQAAMALSQSRATYYRRLQEAVQGFMDWLSMVASQSNGN